jgi:hypothetical protein
MEIDSMTEDDDETDIGDLEADGGIEGDVDDDE